MIRLVINPEGYRRWRDARRRWEISVGLREAGRQVDRMAATGAKALKAAERPWGGSPEGEGRKPEVAAERGLATRGRKPRDRCGQ